MRVNRLGARRGSRLPRRYGDNVGKQSRKHRPDYKLIVMMSFLLTLGAVTIYSIGPGITAIKGLGENYYTYRQLSAIGLGLVAFMVASVMNIKTWKRLEIPLIGLAVLVTIAVRAFGDPINGAYRWLDIGGISFQAAELIKFALIVWLAGFLAKAKLENKVGDPYTFKIVGIVGLVVVSVVAILQSDLGSAGVMIAIIGFMIFIAGMPLKKLLLISGIVIIFISLAVLSSSYRRDRVVTYLNPAADCQNEGYQACQALITIGSGGLIGRGLGKSVQAYGYLPEAANDSIFAIIAEKFGFIGTTITIAAFVSLFRRMKLTAEYAPNEYSRFLVGGFLAWLSAQMIINIGAMLGILPLKGITLPFVSFGGTSIIFVMMAIGVVFQVSRYTDLSNINEKRVGSSRKILKSPIAGRGVVRSKWSRL